MKQNPTNNKNSTPKRFWHTVETTATQAQIWEIWTDVPTWKQWDLGLKDAKLTEPFRKGAEGIVITHQGMKPKFKILEFEEGKFYTFSTDLPFCKLMITRSFEKGKSKTNFTHEVWFAGFSAGFFSLFLGKEFMKSLPKSMRLIKEIAEAK